MENLVSVDRSTESPRTRVVGLGGSADCIDEVQQFLGALPAAPEASVVVLLSGTLDSECVDELRAALSLPVHVVTEPVDLEANHVYVPASGHTVLLEEHTLIPRKCRSGTHHSPVDRFFRSMAQAGVESVGVVLSGTGTDGSRGLQFIAEAGGVIGVQDPTEAARDGMPRHAIETNRVDFVQPVARLARQIAALGRTVHPLSVPSAEALTEKQRGVLRTIFEHVRTETGHDFQGYKRSTVLRRIQRRMRIHQVPTLAEYLTVLRNRPGEAADLKKDLLISVTQFFRDPEAFGVLRDTVLPELLSAKTAHDPVRVWVPGCATGEEAYAVAMLLLEQAEEAGLERDQIEVFATDVDGEALARARRGRYPESIAADVPEAYLQRYFQPHGAELAVREVVRERVLFTTHNLFGDPPFINLDLVSCRNVLIYLRRSLQEKAFDLFHFGLRTDGYLFLGSVETADLAAEAYRPVSTTHRLYRRRAVEKSVPRLSLNGRPAGPDRAPVKQREPSPKVLHRRALEAYAPASMLVDDQFQVVHLSSSVSPYLEYSAGTPSTNALALVRSELRAPLRTALTTAFDEQRPVETSTVAVNRDGAREHIRLEVRPAGSVSETEGLALVLFRQAEASDGAKEDDGAEEDERDPTSVAPRDRAAELRRVRQELWSTRAQYHTSREEMQAANEELRSMNEEYRSIGEEVETANRRLEALNQTLEEKVEALQTATDDLQNLVTATQIGALFLDRDLCIRRYTDRVESLVHIRPSDTGHPIDDLSHRLEYDRLRADAAAVLEDLTPVTQEVRTDADDWVLVQHHPYRTSEDRIDGVVVTFVDITTRKEAEAQQQRACEALQDRTAQVEVLAEALTAAEQRERDRLSRLLHDNLQQLIYAARIKVDNLKERASLGADHEALAERAIALLDESVEVTRTLSTELSPPVGDRSVRDLMEWLGIRMQESYGLSVAIQSRGDIHVAEPTVRTLLFRVVRELLFNVVKHAGVDEARLRVEGTDTDLRVVVEDEGQGFDPSELDRSEGLGLGNVLDRIEMVGGTVSIDAAPGEGTRVQVVLPRGGMGGDQVPAA